MKLRSQWFQGYASEVMEEVAKWSEGRQGTIQNVQVVFRDGDTTGRPTKVVVWYWDD